MSSPVNRHRAIETCRNWNQAFPIGTKAALEGNGVVLWSHAGLGLKDEPSVFIEGEQEAVPISRLSVPGWVMVNAKKHKGLKNGSGST